MVDDKTMMSIMADLKRGKSWDYIAQRYNLGNDARARRVVREYIRRKEYRREEERS